MIANLLTGLGIDEYFTRADSAGTSTFLTDALGSTLALTDPAGALQTQYTYEAFGRTTASGASSTNPFQYTGRELDGTSIYYYRARYYHPGLQRFISEDPIEFAGGDVNLYAYVLNSPTNYTDPTGEIWVQIGGCALGAGISILNDHLSGRKIDWVRAGVDCLIGAATPRVVAELTRFGPLRWLNTGRYLRIGEGRYGGEMVPRIGIGPSPQNQQYWWGHWRLWP